MGACVLTEAELRAWVVKELALTGFRDNHAGLTPPTLDSKQAIRDMHARQRIALLERYRDFIIEWEETLVKKFADGGDVSPTEISPRVVQVSTDEEAALFRFASLHWSVPVSQGFGRRTRFLVFDDYNGSLMGVFALGDPVFNLNARDEKIDWDSGQRKDRLYNVLDAFVLGALPPYRELIGGKMIAMAAISEQTRHLITKKYSGTTTEILQQEKNPRPVLITTTSALGRSSIYNRLKLDGRLLYEPVGFTRGYGHFQFSSHLFLALCDYLEAEDELEGNRFGNGPNWRMRSIRVALTKLGFDPDLLRHGVERQVFLAPLAKNWDRFLRGEVDRPRWHDLDLAKLGAHYVDKWAGPRSDRDTSYKEVSRESMRLTPLLS